MAIPEEHIQKVMQLLVAWNPLGDRVNTIEQLDDYRTEAIDILFHLSLNGPNASPARIVQDVLNEAFDLHCPLKSAWTLVGRYLRLWPTREGMATPLCRDWCPTQEKFVKRDGSIF